MFHVSRFRKILPLTAYCLSLFLFSALPASAAGPSIFGDAGTLLEKCYESGNYPLAAFLQLAGTIIQYIFGISGSLALLAFIYGGFMWLISGGEQKRIQQGQDTLVNASIGLGIIFGSWVLINFIMNTLVVGTGGVFPAILLNGAWSRWDAAQCITYP